MDYLSPKIVMYSSRPGESCRHVDGIFMLLMVARGYTVGKGGGFISSLPSMPFLLKLMNIDRYVCT